MNANGIGLGDDPVLFKLSKPSESLQLSQVSVALRRVASVLIGYSDGITVFRCGGYIITFII
jgi:hypothetical protein